MLLLITPQNKRHYKEILKDMFFARYRVFKQKLGWNIPCEGFLEKDQFDHDHAYYLVYLGYKGEVVGGMRMMSTAVPHMTRDVFRDAVDDPMLLPSSPCVFECSRFFVDTEAYQDYASLKERLYLQSPTDVQKVVSELLVSLMEFGLGMNLSSIITVSEIRMERILRRSGWSLNRLGQPKNMGDSLAVVGTLEVSEVIYSHLCEKAGIHYPVLWAPLYHKKNSVSS